MWQGGMPLLIAFLAAVAYWWLVLADAAVQQADMPNVAIQHASTLIPDTVPDLVLTAPVQVLMYGGDRFLAANIETIRAQAEMISLSSEGFRLRAHRAASLLNPCHEDNYWFGNASLSWGGAIAQGMDVLGYASQCRYWDEWPAFFYAFNQNFFYQDIREAQRVLHVAAARSPQNAPAFLTYATMLDVGNVQQTQMALTMLKQAKADAKSEQHQAMLEKRIVRLQGLLILRQAQQTYEKKSGKPLQNIHDLITNGIIEAFPEDPMQLGYELKEGIFQMRQLRIQ